MEDAVFQSQLYHDAVTDIPQQQIIDRIAADITEEDEDIYVGALREYYRRNFKNGEHHESFLLWLEGKLGMHDD